MRVLYQRPSIGVIVLVTAMLSLIPAVPALAHPPEVPNGQPDHDTYVPPRTPAEAAFERAKAGIVGAIGEYAKTGVWVGSAASGIMPDFVCETDCGGGGGGGGGTPPASMTLPTRARHQSTAWWCGPASGQVVINYSRGYVYSSLDGDSTTTNWRTQTTIADWMDTTQQDGTTSWKIAQALNRDDAVRKPADHPEWVYLRSTNSDGEQLHNRVVTDISYYEMPLIVAVMPHKDNAAYWLPSWPNESPGSKHFITIRGYDGFWDGTTGPDIYYNDSSGNGGMGPGAYETDSLTMWKVNHYNADTIVW